MFYKIFLELCEKKEKKPNKVAEEIGLSNATATSWKQGSVPRDSTLLKLAHYFDVSIEYLKGEEKEKPSDEPKAAIISFNENEEKLLECFRACDLEGQIKILNTAIEQRDAREKITRSKTTTNA